MAKRRSPRDPYHFGRVGLALALLPWMSWALLRAFPDSGPLLANLLQFLILLSVPAALTVSAIGLFSDARKAYAISALILALVYSVTFFLLLIRQLFHFIATH